MIKISRVEAYQYMNQLHFDLMDSTHTRLAEDGANKNKELFSQFFVGANKDLYLVFYLDGIEVEAIHFSTIRIRLTVDGERRLAEAIEKENRNMKNKNVEVVAGLDKGSLEGRVFKLDQSKNRIEVDSCIPKHLITNLYCLEGMETGLMKLQKNMKTIRKKLANDFNRKSFTKEFGRMPYNDCELIKWVLLIVEDIKGNKKSLIFSSN